jgi:hypothetical protein
MAERRARGGGGGAYRTAARREGAGGGSTVDGDPRCLGPGKCHQGQWGGGGGAIRLGWEGVMRMEGEWGLAQWLKDEAMGDGAWARGYKMEMEGGGPVWGGGCHAE